MSAVAEAAPAQAAAAPVDANRVDEQNPWLGLDSFSEETRHFFHGREEEIAELARRVQRKTLAILFGQSGLGKTSILRAGIVPRLRREGYCPVYVRIDYSRESPPPSQQIKQAIFRATENAGEWTRPGSSVPGESLWEFLHHRDDYLRDAEGRPLIPLLIFDQFEEIFTLGQDNDFGRARAAEFLDDLADLVENRPPKALEVMLESEEAIVERFDFNRVDYRVLIALREDYLAHLEGLKSKMPSITQNRMRLARMTGQQALAAVLKPGGKLVSEEVAESIVRFVAGGSELRNAEVEPSLLSLVCRELNNARIAQGREEISADLLAGSRDTILHDFYERALADQPSGVRRFIEDEMLTESGFRESLAEERALRAFAAAGAAPDALATLVNRRLLRIEERLDVRRVEITHDVLCAVVAESRELRHEREAKEEAERQLAEQRAREEATHRALIRARKIAAGCAMLALVAVGSAIFGYINMKRAKDAEAAALTTRAMAESARGEAEKLIVFLLDDFYIELEPMGRLDIIASLSKRAIDYYAALPAELRSSDTQRNRALALVRYGYALRNLGKVDEAGTAMTEAVGILKDLHAKGDQSEATVVGLGLGLAGLARVYDGQARLAEGMEKAAEGEALLRTQMEGSPSVRVKRAYAAGANYLGFTYLRGARLEEAIRMLEAARAAYRSIDDGRLEDLSSAASYAESTAWVMEALHTAGRGEEATRIGNETLPIASRVLERRPGDMLALRARALIQANLADIVSSDLRMEEVLRLSKAGAADWETLLKLDPGNAYGWNNVGVLYLRQAAALIESGRIEEGIKELRHTMSLLPRVQGAPGLVRNFMLTSTLVKVYEAETGIKAAEGLASPAQIASVSAANLAPDAPARVMVEEAARRAEAWVAYVNGDYERVRAILAKSIPRLEAVKPPGSGGIRVRHNGLREAYQIKALAHYYLGQFEEAEKAARQSEVHHNEALGRSPFDRIQSVEARVIMAASMARLGRADDARAVLDREIEAQREWMKRGGYSIQQQTVYARALFAAALASPANARAYLAEATAVMNRLPPEAQRLKTTSRLRDEIRAQAAKRV